MNRIANVNFTTVHPPTHLYPASKHAGGIIRVQEHILVRQYFVCEAGSRRGGEKVPKGETERHGRPHSESEALQFCTRVSNSGMQLSTAASMTHHVPLQP